jgi:chemotaxis-related protein WspB
MLFLVFELGADRYALDVRQVAEVLPLVSLKRIPQAPATIAGLFDYRGAAVPAVDVSQLTLGRSAERRLSTRIILVNYPDATGVPRLLGLIAERTTRTVRRDAADFVYSSVASDAAPYLGPVATDGGGLLQWVDAHTLLPASIRDMLFKQSRDQRWAPAISKPC